MILYSTFSAQNVIKWLFCQATRVQLSQDRLDQIFESELIFNVHTGDLVYKYGHILTLCCSIKQKCDHLLIERK